MTNRILACVALPLVAFSAVAAMAQSGSVPPGAAPRVTIEHRAALRCSAVFAIIANDQQRGIATSGAPVLGTRGREYFVRTSARVMDEAGVTRDAVQGLLHDQAVALRAGQPALAAVLPSCMALLDAAVPALATPNPAQCSAIAEIAFAEARGRAPEAPATIALGARAASLRTAALADLARQGQDAATADRSLVQARDALLADGFSGGSGVSRYDAGLCTATPVRTP